MPRLITVALALSLLLNAFFIAGFVFRGWIAPLPFEQRVAPTPGSRPSALETVAKEVNLDEKQRQALRGIMEQHAKVRRERADEMQKVREQIVDEYRRTPLDQARLDPLVDKLGDLRAEQQKETVRALMQFEAELSPQQRERMHQVLVDRLLASPWYRPSGASSAGRPSQ
jgi:Spy/CpxP family protein refolding chaperone